MDQITSTIQTLLNDSLTNPNFNKKLLRATIGIVLVNGGITLLYKSANAIVDAIKNKFLLTLEINNKDESFQWILTWLAEQPYTQKTNQITMSTTYDSEQGNAETNTRPRVLLTPSIGSHLLSYKGKWLWVSRNRFMNALDFASGNFLETINVSVFGRDRKIIHSFISECMDAAFLKEEGRTIIWSGSGGSWRKFGKPRARRPLESVILQEGIKEKVISDIKEFIKSAPWYREMGIPYRRGYLFHGYPGCGKTSLILSLAGEFHMNICIVSLNDKDMSDEQLNHLLNSAPPRSILLLEDVDAAFWSRESVVDTQSRITFSGLLNALDGVAAQEGKLVFMTTNHIEKLDKALIRPGRVDLVCDFGLATKYQIVRVFNRFYSNTNETQAAEFAAQIPEGTVTMAELQGYLLQYKTSPQEAISQVKNWLTMLPKKEQRNNADFVNVIL